MIVHLSLPRGGAACGDDVEERALTPEINEADCSACLDAHEALMADQEDDE